MYLTRVVILHQKYFLNTVNKGATKTQHEKWSSAQPESDLNPQQQAGDSENADFNYKLYLSIQFTVYTWCIPPYELSEQLLRKWV